MQNLLGGKVTVKGKSYSWAPGADWGNMGRIAADILKEDSDILYVMAVPCWGNHANNNEPDRHLTVQMYNGLLKDWVGKYAKAHGKKMVFVDVNKGLVDSSLAVPFSWPDSMSNKPGRDGLHPNEQGSMIIAGNLAAAMGLPGRTAGLERAAATDWKKPAKKLRLREKTVVLKKPFSSERGYSVEFSSSAGKGELVVKLGDEAGSSQLRLSDHKICWGDKPLYCLAARETGVLRLVWHPGMDGNRPKGYYVWWNGMLVGQALPPDSPTGQGLRLEAVESSPSVNRLKYTDGAFAPEI
jgi:hypothetical protein